MLESKQGAEGRLIKRIVFGVFGNAGHGKDTVANLIMAECRARKIHSKKFALADPLKRVAMELIGMPAEVAFGTDDVAERERLRQSWAAYGKNGRQWLQWVGTELGREQISPDLWVDRAVDTVVADTQGIRVFAIADCRFHNERIKLFEKFTERYVAFFTIRVKRPDVPINSGHQSESEVASMTDDLFNAVLVNDGTVDDLRAKVKVIFSAIPE